MTGQPTPKGAWKITFLLFLFMVVNFADKVVVGLAGVPIMNDLKLDAGQFGELGSSFFLLFSISAIIVGFIVNRVQTRWVLLAMAIIWSLAQFPMVGTVSFTTLLICRIVLGAGEGPAFSVAAHAIYKWFPDEKRTLPTAILSQGSAFGVILAVPALNWVIVNHSWHYAFGALARPPRVHALHRQGARLLAEPGRLHLDPALGVRCDHRHPHRLDLAGDDGARLHHAHLARRARLGAADHRRPDPRRDGACAG